jgi:hypothetical protein
VHKSTPVTQTQPQFQSPVVSAQPPQQSTMQPIQAPQPSNFMTTGTQDPRIAMLVNELKKQQKLTANMQQQSGYVDKLFSKKKDLLRILQLSLIIVLAMSVHFIVDYYMKNYLKNNDLTFERELIIRMLYPVSVLFILWNMKAFIK